MNAGALSMASMVVHLLSIVDGQRKPRGTNDIRWNEFNEARRITTEKDRVLQGGRTWKAQTQCL